MWTILQFDNGQLGICTNGAAQKVCLPEWLVRRVNVQFAIYELSFRVTKELKNW